jgi:hypothetical protein
MFKEILRGGVSEEGEDITFLLTPLKEVLGVKDFLVCSLTDFTKNTLPVPPQRKDWTRIDKEHSPYISHPQNSPLYPIDH